jgi:YHS domain-containing protein
MTFMNRLPDSALLSLVFLALPGLAEDRVFLTEAGAIRGYDPVAYHTEGKPVPGDPEIRFDWEGATWHFSSAANRDAFAANPAKYAPAYGGYCAYGTANGYKVSTAPEAFAIEDGRLYLNYSVGVQKTWNKDRPGYIQKADANWSTLEDEAYESDEATIDQQESKSRE